MDTAVELVEDRLAKGPRCGYHFLFAEQDGRTVGYTSFGPIACTRESYDLYWIVVAGDYRGKGLGTQLLEQTRGGHRLLRRHAACTSRPPRARCYEPTRAFYLARGYTQIAELEDFYAPGDAKAMYLKVLPAGSADRRCASPRAIVGLLAGLLLLDLLVNLPGGLPRRAGRLPASSVDRPAGHRGRLHGQSPRLVRARACRCALS